MLAVSLMVVEHECIVCILFQCIIWYFPLPQGSITNWNEFKTKFLKKIGEDKIPTTLVLELYQIKMNTKENIKDFNKIFLMLMKKIPEHWIQTTNVLIEFYTTTLTSSISIFVKRRKFFFSWCEFEETIVP